MTGEIREGDVVRYTSERENRWCREELAIGVRRHDGTVGLLDTYWEVRDPTCDHWLSEGELATVQHLFNLHDFRQVQHEPEWRTYAPFDRQVVTAQHGLVRRYYVRIGAEPDLATQIANARQRLAERETEALLAAQRVEWARRELADLEAATEPDPARLAEMCVECGHTDPHTDRRGQCPRCGCDAPVYRTVGAAGTADG
jgi:hypothetical protein